MTGWIVAALCAFLLIWALTRASYWKWMWKNERSLNQALMEAARRGNPKSPGTVTGTERKPDETRRSGPVRSGGRRSAGRAR